MAYDGTAPIGSVLSSTGNGIPPIYNTAPTGLVQHLTGNIGGQLNPDINNNFTLLTANATVKFVGAASTITQDFGLSNLFLGSSGSTITAGLNNAGLGLGALASITSGSNNIAMGSFALNAANIALQNVAIGTESLFRATGAQNNVSIGMQAMNNATTATAANNVAIGYHSMLSTTTANQNTCVGALTGTAYTTSEANNINLGYNVTGTVAESNVIRIGNTSNTSCFITGIDGVNVGSVAKVLTMASNQIGTATITPGAGITVTPGANTITIASTAAGLAWSVVTVNASFTVNTGTIANKAGTLTMTLPATAAIGDIIEITGINTAAGWSIAQNANQQIFFGNQSTTVGVTGSLTSTAIRDSLKMVCVVAGASTVWNVVSAVGNITVA